MHRIERLLGLRLRRASSLKVRSKFAILLRQKNEICLRLVLGSYPKAIAVLRILIILRKNAPWAFGRDGFDKLNRRCMAATNARLVGG